MVRSVGSRFPLRHARTRRRASSRSTSCSSFAREWFQHPNGALPAYEWDFGDVNPPVQAWAALEVFAIDGAHDFDFLERVFDKLLVNFTWWINLEDAEGRNLFEGGFLGLDNVGPMDRSHLPVDGRLAQSDATGWMAFYTLTMASIATILKRAGRRPADDLILKFLDHFAAIRQAMESSGVWDDEDGFYYDQLVTPGGAVVPAWSGRWSGSSRVGRCRARPGGPRPSEGARQGRRPARRGTRRSFGPDRTGCRARRAG